MITDKMVEAACAAFCSFQHEKKGVTSIEEFDRADPLLGVAIRKAMRAALEAADKECAPAVYAHVVTAEFITGHDRDEGDERPEGCYITMRFPLATMVWAGAASVVLPSPPDN